ncbi:hypothetical protein PENSPDRAFT_647299 [Peniophora sp. CONT]|nr:hypothetical protein PENSPDRAFT_647299 [Peniophora sp. CONT]
MEARRHGVERETLVIDAKLEILRSQQQQLAALLASVTSQCDGLLQRRRFLHASLIPLNFLPNELLCAIFNLVMDTSPPPPLDALVDIVPMRLSQISSRFRSIALAMPNLWRRLVIHTSDTHDNGPRRITNAYMSRLGHIHKHPVDAFYYNNSAAKLDTEPSRLLILIRLPPVSSLTIDAAPSAILDLASHISLGLITGLRALSSLTLSMRGASIAGLSDLGRRIGYHRTRAAPPVAQDLLLHLTRLELKDVPLSIIPATPLPRLQEVTIEFTCIFDTVRTGSNEQIPATYTSNHELARFFRCAPNIKRLAFLDAGPFFVKPLNPDLNAEEFWADPAAWRADPAEVPAVPLNELRELEYTSTHGPAFFHFLSFFPSPALEELRLGIIDAHRSNAHPPRGPRRLVRDNMLPENMDDVLSSITLPSLRTVRAEATTGDDWKHVFNRILVPALETLVIENTNFSQPEKCNHQSTGACLACTTPFASLMRVENIFRDPRLVTLRRLELAGVDVEPEVAENWIGYVPALKELVCDYTQGALHIMNALAPRGALVPCPGLQRIELWGCNDFFIGNTLKLTVDTRLKASGRPGAATMINGRKVKMLKRVERAGGAKPIGKIESIKVGACKMVSEADAKALEEMGVEVDWTAPDSDDMVL